MAPALAGEDLTTFTGRPRLRTLLAPEPGLPTAWPAFARATTLPLSLLARSCALADSPGAAPLPLAAPETSLLASHSLLLPAACWA